MGYLILEGGAEFGGGMREPDLKGIELAGGFDAPVRIVPTAAAPDRNHQRAGTNGIRWFQSLGARDVMSVPLIDKPTSNDAKIVESLRIARLIYILGGFTGYLGETLAGSKAWEAALEVYRTGAVIAGSSAGAMVMCEYYYDPRRAQLVEGLNLVPNSIVLPHHNTFGKVWAGRLVEISHATLVGIDEQTGMVDNGNGKRWTVMGRGSVTLYRGDREETYGAGDSFSL